MHAYVCRGNSIPHVCRHSRLENSLHSLISISSPEHISVSEVACSAADGHGMVIDTGFDCSYACMQFGHEDFDDHEGSVTVDISLLTGFDHMGMLEVACGGGCICNTSLFDSCKPGMTGEEAHWAYQHVEVSREAKVYQNHAVPPRSLICCI